MRYRFWTILAMLCLTLQAIAQTEPHMHPVRGPAQVKLGDNLATLDLPDSMLYLNVADTKQFLEATGNVPSGHEVGIVAPKDHDKSKWFVIIEYNDSGYVADDDAGKLNADEILQNIREGTDSANEARKSAGQSTLSVVGWAAPPVYERSTHHVVWAVRGRSSDAAEGDVINYNTRILGRKGVLEMNLVCDPAELEADKKGVGLLLDKTQYTAGQRYEDYQAGTDKKAEYGLAGLILGGVALKTGLLAKLGSYLIYILLALKKLVIVIFAGIAGLFRKLTGGKKTNTGAPVETVVKE